MPFSGLILPKYPNRVIPCRSTGVTSGTNLRPCLENTTLSLDTPLLRIESFTHSHTATTALALVVARFHNLNLSSTIAGTDITDLSFLSEGYGFSSSNADLYQVIGNLDMAIATVLDIPFQCRVQ